MQRPCALHLLVVPFVAVAAFAAGAEDAADAVLAAVRKGDAAALKTAGESRSDDPWVVADELLRRGEAKAAAALAKACPETVAGPLGAYVEVWKAPEGDAEQRTVIAAAMEAALKKKGAEALAALAPVKREVEDVLAIRIRYIRGMALRQTGRQVEGAESLRDGGRMAERLRWYVRASALYQSSAEASLAGQDAEAAFVAIDDRLRMDRASARKDLESEGLRSLGTLHAMTGNNAEAMKVLESAVATAKESGDPGAIGRCNSYLGAILVQSGELAKGAELLEAAIPSLEQGGNPALLADARSNLGNVFIRQGQYARALPYIEQGLEQFRRGGVSDGIVGNLLMIAQCKGALGNIEEAKAALAQARQTAATSPGPPSLEARILVTEGNLFFAAGEYARALVNQEKALDLFTGMKDAEGISRGYSLVGNLHIALGDNRRAVEYLAKALEIQRKAGDRHSVSVTLGNMALVHFKDGEYEKAVPLLEESLSIKGEIGDRMGTASSLANLAAAYSHLGRKSEALEKFEKALAISEEAGDRATAARTLGNIGDLHVDGGRLPEALRCLEKALAAAEEVGAREIVYVQLAGMARARFAMGEPAKALALCRRAAAELSGIFGGLGDEQGAMARGQFTEAFEIGIRSAAAVGDTEALWFFLESERAGTLLESLGNRKALASAVLPPALRDAAEAARLEVASCSDSMADAVASKELARIAPVRKALEAARQREKEAVERIQREAKAAAALLYPRTVSLEEARGRLSGPGEAVLLFGKDGEEAIALLVGKEFARLVRLGPEAGLAAAVEGHLFGDFTMEATVPLEALGKRIADPLAVPAGVRRLIVSPSGALSSVPLSAAWPDREVLTVPSCTTWCLLRDSVPAPGKGVLAMGDPEYGAAGAAGTRAGPVLSALPATRAEATAVGTAVLLGKEATETALRARLGAPGRWRSVHLACHGILDPRDASRSSLALAADAENDGFVTVLEVFGLKTQADLVALSACETGRGTDFRAEGLLGFPRAFMLAGASRVLVSLWKVDDEATRALMETFYRLWNPASGQSVGAAEALRRAQEAVRTQPKWRHPAYWAAWQLWGLGE
jgi:tetratricopeptide (TPR) repeat protein